MTVKELQDNLKECMNTAGDLSMRKLQRAKVVGIACNVCEPDDVHKLANFAVHELGSINIWVSDSPFSIGCMLLIGHWLLLFLKISIQQLHFIWTIHANFIIIRLLSILLLLLEKLIFQTLKD